MATVHQWSGQETRILRHALRLTVRAFAEDLGVCVRTVSKWEAIGPALTPRPEIQAALDTMLRRAGDEDRERFHATATNDRPATSDRPAASDGLAEGDGPAGTSPGGASTQAQLPIEAQQLAAALADARRYLDGAVVGYFRQHLAQLKADDGQPNARPALLPLLLGTLGAIQEHAAEVTPKVRRDLLAVGADSAEFAGWLYRDAHDTTRALYWHDRATEWAQEAGDRAMQGYVLLKKAQLAFDARQPLRMLTLSEAVGSGPWRLPLRVQAEAVQQQARAEAMLGAPLVAVQNRLDQAHQLLHRAIDRPDDSPLSAHYNLALLTLQTAACHTAAGQPDRAIELYHTALTPDRFSPRDYGFFLSWLAAAQALAGAPDQAAATGLASASYAAAADSSRTRRELVRVLETLWPWRHRSAVQELAAAVGLPSRPPGALARTG